MGGSCRMVWPDRHAPQRTARHMIATWQNRCLTGFDAMDHAAKSAALIRTILS